MGLNPEPTRTGGIYSSLNDQLKLGRGILRSELLSPADTRRWMKPVTHTESLVDSVGAPWEIVRTGALIPGRNRIVDIYSKSGGLIGYSTWIALIPDYGLVLSGLLAGPGASIQPIANFVLGQLVRVVDQVAREQASNQFAGRYVSRDGTNSSLTLVVDDGPGLRVEGLVARGRQVYSQLATLPLIDELFGGFERPSLRLYPTGLTSGASRPSTTPTNSTSASRVSFRAVLGEEPSLNRTEARDRPCSVWSQFDGIVYGTQALDEFIFDLSPEGRVERMEARGWRLVMEKQSS